MCRCSYIFKVPAHFYVIFVASRCYFRNYEYNASKCCTSSTGCLRSAVGRPGRLLTPPYAGGSNNTQEVDGVRLQVFQEMLGLLSR